MPLATETSTQMQYKAGERIFAEGDPSYYCYQIVRGRVDIVLSPKGRREVIATLGPGEVFGEMGVIDSGPRSATAIAAEDTECIVFGALDLLDEFDEEPVHDHRGDEDAGSPPAAVEPQIQPDRGRADAHGRQASGAAARILSLSSASTSRSSTPSRSGD
jgi:CRP-like cAMP-binding protein